MSDAENPPPTVLEVIEADNWLWEPGEIKVVPLGRPATIANLRRTKLKAEIVNGELHAIGPPAARAGSRPPRRWSGTTTVPALLVELRIGG
ncbi:MAG TPA: hypothetical protein VE871_19715 [Longimicrobium sp.]|nr:hypothetical protein [Longimicrobium sp.]